ncbi:MAG: TonB-dependent receptor [Pseudomonadota bacterium]|nr:TonB-dependent receptor [Pseudomonadota bacterium]
MSLALIIAAAAAQADPSIIVTGSREALAAEEAPISATLFDQERIDALALPSSADLMRLSPGVSVAASGPRGTQTQLRIRGAEANHTLLFVDGIRFNDPAAGNEARFELLTADLLSRIEIVRGPQSALWGSEALGGVVAVAGADPFAAGGFAGLAEYGSLDSSRLFGRVAHRSGALGLTAAAGWQRSDGIDSFGNGGEADGFDNVSANLKAIHRGDRVEVGAVGHWISGRSEFDGFDPVTFRRADTLDATRNRIGALRGWASVETGHFSVRTEASYLDSSNRNFLGGEPLNRTAGERLTLGAQATARTGEHQLIVAAERQEEDFRARDTIFFGGTDQDRSRSLTALVAEWRAQWTERLSTDVALRHDAFSAFEDAATLRAAVLIRPRAGWGLHAAYGEGIAQPTFYDLYGFFPDFFIGNPDLRPEHSRGWEAGVRWEGSHLRAGLAAFSNRLAGEIIDVFDPVTFRSSTANSTGRSRRRGIEAWAECRPAPWLNLAANYTWLDAEQPESIGEALVREVRRPRHSANVIAHGETGRVRWGAALGYVGARRDTDFDLAPARAVRLAGYLLASANLSWRISAQLELFGRVENAFGARYQDVVGYDTAGRTVHAGLRVAVGR